MKKAALLGRDIGYTRSPEVHAAIAEAIGEKIRFDVFDTPYDKLDDVVPRLLAEYDGFYITKPYKNDVKRYLKKINTRCGVNFVCGGEGYNTDGPGFVCALDRAFADWRSDVSAAVVLGAGGAAYAVTEALKTAGKSVYVLNRTAMNAAKLCGALGAELYLNQPAELIVNCTTMGLHGEDAMSALCVMPTFKYAYDLIYSPPETPFLRRNAKEGSKTSNGGDMLIFQAIEGDKMLFGKQFDTQAVFDKVSTILGG